MEIGWRGRLSVCLREKVREEDYGAGGEIVEGILEEQDRVCGGGWMQGAVSGSFVDPGGMYTPDARPSISFFSCSSFRNLAVAADRVR